MQAVVAFLAGSAAALVPLSGRVPARHAAAPNAPRVASLTNMVATAPSISGTPAVGYDAWAAELDYKAFRKEVHALGTRLANEQGEADVAHLRRMIMWSNGFGAMGLATMWMSSPVGRLLSIIGLSTWTCTRWTM